MRLTSSRTSFDYAAVLGPYDVFALRLILRDIVALFSGLLSSDAPVLPLFAGATVIGFVRSIVLLCALCIHTLSLNKVKTTAQSIVK